MGFKYPINFKNPDNRNEIRQIIKYLKFFLIWLISVLLSGFLKLFGYFNPDLILINNFLLLLLVFGPALLVTIILVFNKVLNS